MVPLHSNGTLTETLLLECTLRLRQGLIPILGRTITCLHKKNTLKLLITNTWPSAELLSGRVGIGTGLVS